MEKKRKSFAGRIIRKILIWLFFIVIALSYVIFQLEGRATREFYSEIFHNKMLITNEYTRRVISDVYVAVTNNIYYVEQTLDNPDCHKETMERIVKSGTRVRSCGISFIEDYYYPQKGHKFCPYAWRNVAKPDVIFSENMGDADADYLSADWFVDVVNKDSAQWSEPFYESYDEKTTLSAYMVPVHDKTGRTVAVIGADISLDWLTNKLLEMDSTINKNDMLMASKFDLKSNSFIINHDGTYMTHHDEKRIMKENFFNQVEACDGSDVEGLITRMKDGIEQEHKKTEKFIVDGEECYLFYTPVKYTQWVMVTVVPCHAIDTLSLLNGLSMSIMCLLAMLSVVIVCYFYIKSNFDKEMKRAIATQP
jgi:hypothetical protein